MADDAAILQAVFDCIITTDAEGMVVAVNEATGETHMVGHPVELPAMLLADESSVAMPGSTG